MVEMVNKNVLSVTESFGYDIVENVDFGVCWFSKRSDHILKPGGGSSFKALLAVNAAKGVP
jgi:hypothetical protein